MRRHARSENRKIVRKLGEPAGEAEGAAEIGSRIFPFRAPPASMPSVGTRRSTRVFVSKAAAKAGGGGDGEPVERVLRSGKRLTVSEQAPGKKTDGGSGNGVQWLRLLGGGGDTADLQWWKGEGKKVDLGVGDEWREPAAPESAGGADESVNRRGSMDSPDGGKFGIAYSRKRRRPRSDDAGSSLSGVGDRDSEKDRKYGIVFARKQPRKKPKVEPLVQEVSGETGKIDREQEEISRRTGREGDEIRVTESARDFAEKVGISENDIWTGLSGSMVLAVLIDSSCGSSSHKFSRLLISVVSWMKRARVRFWQFAAFLLSEAIANAFSLNGVHFLPARPHKNNIFFSTPIPACGLCKMYGARQFIPMLSLDFSAIPFFFKSLHVGMVLRSQYLPGVLARYIMGLHTSFPVAVRFEEYDSHIPWETGYSGTEIPVSVITAVKRNESHNALESPRSVGRSAVILHGSRLRKHQRKRSFSRHSRSRHPFLMNSHPGSLRSDLNNVGVSPEARTLSLRDSFVEPLHVKTTESCINDFLSGRDDSDVSTPLGSHEKHRKSSMKSPIEFKLALVELKQNMDLAHCRANVLVTVTDRCWREEGANVMLEFSHSKDWCIAVKVRGMTRYLHKPQDMRPCVVNRFTHAYMWSGEDGWKLEFCDRWDWLVFKELHMECRERNLQSSQDGFTKTIPVPVVCEVSDYEDGAMASFVRPDCYIRMMDDEVGRALASNVAIYDMDLGDEEWLNQLNTSSSDVDNSGFSHISDETFEKIVSVLEKDAYNNPNDIYKKERALDLCQDLGNRDMLAAVYDYWVEKRNQKRAALVRAFQYDIPTPRRAQFIQRPLFRKKRSFKRQRSQYGRGKPEFFLEAGAKEEASQRRVQEAENAADRAVESAIQLRTRAQMLMSNAELAAYKSVMALKIADAIRVSESPDLASSVLD
uniref:Enhancer of polycomb-like protein n=1 Tax=Elaeis guineensis var. tenera TaxID=51953 RepID=A0A6I9RXF6_ELAGV|nr:uncharacterized protein LOC105054271 [Elaeis guineensis]XP_029123040.1 uncharacterized protein LOC105054271 [Elaeis guineensis]